MSRYAIWNKKDPVFTPVGSVLTAEQWIEKYPIAGIDSITVVCGGGEINGAYFGTLGQMIDSYAHDGCDFSNCVTDEDMLAAIEAFEDARNAEISENARNEAMNAEMTAMSLASIAASMEYQNMLTFDDVEE